MDLTEMHRKCGEIFKNQLLEKPNGRSHACEIWDKMTGGSKDCENCIGENFNQLILTVIEEWFENYRPGKVSRVEFYAMTYILWLYLFLERIELIFNEIDPNSNIPFIQSFRKGLKTLEQIRIWANFIKHPKNFLFVHWPKYFFIGQAFNRNSDSIHINTAFLKDHFSNEKQDRPKQLENQNSVNVQFPKLEDMTLGFCNDLKEFIRFICDNKMIADLLKIKSNINKQ